MSVYIHDRQPQGNRLSDSPRRTARRPWRGLRATAHRPRLELLESRVVLSPTIFTVDSTGSGISGAGMSGTLPYVISQANANTNADGSEIEFDSSVFSSQQTITLGATLVLSETTGPEVIDGPGAGLVTISGNNTSEVFNIAGDTVASISGLSIIDGNGTYGGGLFNEGTLTITNTTFTGNSAAYGGAIYTRALGDDPLDGFLTLTGDTFTSNSATAESGAIDNWAGGTVTVTDDTFTGNSAPNGGAIGNEWGSVAVSNSTFSNNTASTGAGGAIINYNPSDSFSNSLSVVGSTISGNTAVTGGGVANAGPDTLSLTNDTIAGNSVTGSGGGLYVNGTASLTACTVSGNSANAGGGLYNIGASAVATLTDTIIAANVEPGGAPDDLNGSAAGTVMGSFNLIGIGGSGGITGGSDDNIVLTSLANLGLAPLGNYGGPTETMALLPGSAAIGAGTAASGVTTDQRGAPRPASGAVDIGAFQDQGYTVAVSFGSPQSTLVSQPFSAPLVVRLTENLAGAPLPGATIDFSAPTSGATATLSANSAVTESGGLASVTVTANPTAGTYAVTASAAGVTPPASYSLTNQIQPSFSGLNGQTATYGSTVTITGTLTAGSQIPIGEDVAITIDGVTRDARITSNGSFSTEFTGADVVLNASSTAYSVSYEYATDGVFLAAEGSSQLTINPALLRITAVSDTKVYDGTTNSSQTPTYGTLYNGNTVTGLTQAFSSKNVLGANGSTLMVTGYTVNDGDGGKDYTVTTQTATGTVSLAPLTVRVNNVSTVYGSPLPALTYRISGFVGGDNSSVVSGAPLIATAAASGANAGAYAITIAAATLNATNYDFPAADLIAGTLTVTPAPLVITAASTSIFAGQPVPALTAVYSGFVNGDTPASLTPPPVLHSAASPSSAPGSYTITVSGASSSNYTITYVPGTLTVILAPAMVEKVSIQKIKLSKHKSVQGIVLQFSEALDAADAQNINAYTLVTVPKNKKHKSKPVRLSAASYNSSAFTVTLFTRRTLALNTPIDLTVKAASLLDALDRELDGNDSGQPGSNFTAVLRKAGTSVTSARALAQKSAALDDAEKATLP
jgi:predicted outer membrane repeat protein